MAFDTIIRGGTVATASDTFSCDVGIAKGKIAALGDNLGAASEIVDAEGLLVLPGGIDSHVHIAQPSAPGIVMADDFASGTLAAAFGGNTMVLPFALQQKGESLRQVVKDYHAKADGQCYVDVSFHLIIADASDSVLGQELPALVNDGYTSFKVFMTYEGMALSDMEMLKVMSVARETGALVMVHAENYDAIRFLTDRLEQAGKTEPKYHATSRPIPVEREATHRAISLAEIDRRADHDRARVEPRGDGGDRARTAPRPENLRRDLPAISGAHREGPRRPQHGGRQIRLLAAAARQGKPAGLLAGLGARHLLAVLLRPLSVQVRRPARQIAAQGQDQLPLGAERHSGRGDAAADFVFRRRRQRPHHAQRIRRADRRPITPRPTGSIRRKAPSRSARDADIALWDPRREVTITQKLMHGGCDYTPYEGIKVTGWPVSTMLRGKFVVRDGKLAGKPGDGAYVPREKSELAVPSRRL